MIYWISSSSRQHAKLKRVREITSHSHFDASLADLIEMLADNFLDRRDPLRREVKPRAPTKLNGGQVSQEVVKTDPPRKDDSIAEPARAMPQCDLGAGVAVQSTSFSDHDLAIRSRVSAENERTETVQHTNRRPIKPSVRNLIYRQGDGKCGYRDPATGRVCGSRLKFKLQLFIFAVCVSHSALAAGATCQSTFAGLPKIKHLVGDSQANTLAELQLALADERRMTLPEYLELAKADGVSGYLSYARTAALLLTKTETVSPYTKAAIDAGLRAIGLVVSVEQAWQLAETGSIQVEAPKGVFFPLTDSQIGETPPPSLVPDGRVLLVLKAELIDNVQAMADDSPPGRFQFGSGITRLGPQPSLQSITEDARTVPQLSERMGRMHMIQARFSLPAWAVIGMVGTDRDITALQRGTAAFATVASNRITPYLSRLPFEAKRVTSRTLLFPATRISLLDPMPELPRLMFQGIASSRAVADWYHLIRSRLEVAWKSKHYNGRIVGRLSSVNTNQLGGDVAISILEDNGNTRYIDRSEIYDIQLVEYVPNGPRVGTVTIPRSLLDDQAVRDFLRMHAAFEAQWTIVP